MDFRKVQAGIELLGKINLVANIMPQRVHCPPRFGRRPSFSICFLIYLWLLHEFSSQGIGFALCRVGSSPE